MRRREVCPRTRDGDSTEVDYRGVSIVLHSRPTQAMFSSQLFMGHERTCVQHRKTKPEALRW